MKTKPLIICSVSRFSYYVAKIAVMILGPLNLLFSYPLHPGAHIEILASGVKGMH